MVNWKVDMILSAALFAGGGALLAYSSGIDETAAMFPNLIAVSIMICAVFLVAFAFLRRVKEAGDPINLKQYKNVLLLVLIVVSYGLLMPVLGYIISSLAAFAAISVFLGARKPVTIVISDVCVTAGIYFVFKLLLQVPLPVGFLGI